MSVQTNEKIAQDVKEGNPSDVSQQPSQISQLFGEFVLSSPQKLFGLIGKKLVFKMIDKTSREGYFYSLDPEANTIILISSQKASLEDGETEDGKMISLPMIIFGQNVDTVQGII